MITLTKFSLTAMERAEGLGQLAGGVVGASVGRKASKQGKSRLRAGIEGGAYGTATGAIPLGILGLIAASKNKAKLSELLSKGAIAASRGGVAGGVGGVVGSQAGYSNKLARKARSDKGKKRGNYK